MWIARDENGSLTLFKKKPEKSEEDGEWSVFELHVKYWELDEDLFPEVKWEDDEPRELVLKPIKEKEK